MPRGVPQAPVVDERTEFEKWAITADGNYNPEDLEKTPTGEYRNNQVDRDHAVWQASAKLGQTTDKACSAVVPDELKREMEKLELSKKIQRLRSYNE